MNKVNLGIFGNGWSALSGELGFFIRQARYNDGIAIAEHPGQSDTIMVVDRPLNRTELHHLWKSPLGDMLDIVYVKSGDPKSSQGIHIEMCSGERSAKEINLSHGWLIRTAKFLKTCERFTTVDDQAHVRAEALRSKEAYMCSCAGVKLDELALG